MSEPSMGEILRRLDEQAKATERVVEKLDELTRTMEDRYVPRREYELRVGEVEKDITQQAAFRRQVGAGALIGLLLLVANIVVALARVPGVA